MTHLKVAMRVMNGLKFNMHNPNLMHLFLLPLKKMIHAHQVLKDVDLFENFHIIHIYCKK
jgi:hypothetical protein